MAKLTDTQLIVLSSAVQRDDGAATVPSRMNGAAASKVGSSLVGRKLMREILSKPGMPEWRKDENGRSISLVILRAGRDAIGVNDAVVAPEKSKEQESKGQPDPNPPRTGSKQALVVALLSRKRGATVNELIAATGWLPHTTRAALTGLRKRGHVIERCREDAITHYRIVAATEISRGSVDAGDYASRPMAAAV